MGSIEQKRKRKSEGGGDATTLTCCRHEITNTNKKTRNKINKFNKLKVRRMERTRLNK